MIVIDGHNLLWAVQGSAGSPEVRDEIHLCRLIGRYLERITDAGEIVFDGTGPSDKSDFDNINRLEVRFSGLRNDADSVIERKIEASSATREMTVVSSDRRLRRAAQSRRATAVKSEQFWKTVQIELRRQPTEREPSAKHHGLSESETDQWLEMFGFDQ